MPDFGGPRICTTKIFSPVFSPRVRNLLPGDVVMKRTGAIYSIYHDKSRNSKYENVFPFEGANSMETNLWACNFWPGLYICKWISFPDKYHSK